jgi:CRISPR system Cascade subunit CasE
MFLTRIILSQEDMRKESITDAYKVHQRLRSAFPEESKSPLFKIEKSMKSLAVFVLSETTPSFKMRGIWETKKIPDKFYEYPHYSFKLTANPTIKKIQFDEKGNRKKQGKRIPIVKEEDLLGWIERKLSKIGAEKKSLRISSPQVISSYKRGTRITHSSVEYTGILEVKDNKVFKQAIKQGIGSAKGFGFGLMLLKPVR